MNLIIPEDALGSHIEEQRRKLQISVQNSLGGCESLERHLPHLKSIAIGFIPDIESSYFIKTTLSDSSNKTPPSRTFVLQVNSPDDQANQCFIYEEDMHICNKPQHFCKSLTKFWIYTQKIIHRDSDKLDVFCQGPARAMVKIISNDSSPGVEICEVTPSSPGKYWIDIYIYILGRKTHQGESILSEF